MQYVVEEVLGAHGMINYVDARTAWMDDIVKQAQWQGITQVYPDSVSSTMRAAATACEIVPHMPKVWYRPGQVFWPDGSAPTQLDGPDSRSGNKSSLPCG